MKLLCVAEIRKIDPFEAIGLVVVVLYVGLVVGGRLIENTLPR